jgi:hypothetical protein
MAVRDALISEIAQEVWRRLAMNGSLKIDIDTDVDCYGLWDPHGEWTEDEQVARAQDWVEYFVRSTLNRLAERERDA